MKVRSDKKPSISGCSHSENIGCSMFSIHAGCFTCVDSDSAQYKSRRAIPSPLAITSAEGVAFDDIGLE